MELISGRVRENIFLIVIDSNDKKDKLFFDNSGKSDIKLENLK